MKSKRVISLLCIAALMVSLIGTMPEAKAAEVITPPTTALSIKVNEGDIVLDGRLDEACWQKMEYAADKKLESTPPSNQNTYALAWDNEALYVAVEVRDTCLIADAVLTDQVGQAVEVHAYENDCIEVYVDPDHDMNYGDHTVHFILEALTGRIELMGGADMWGAPEAYADYESMCRYGEIDGGYTGEFRIPFSAMGIESPKAGTVMGFAVCVKDKDMSGAGAEEVYSIDGFLADNPATWGQLCLTDNGINIVANPYTSDIDGKLDEPYRWDFARSFADYGFDVRVGTLCDMDCLYLAFDFTLLDEEDAFENHKLGKFWLFLAGNNEQSADGKSADKHDLEIAVTPPKKRFNTMRVYDPSVSGEPYTKTVSGSGKMNAAFVQYGRSMYMEFKLPWESFKPDRAFLSSIGWEVALEDFLGYTGTLAGCADPWNMNKGYGSIIINNQRVLFENNAPTAVTTLYSYSIAQGRCVTGKLDIKDKDGDNLTYYLAEPFEKNSNGLFEVDSKTGEWKYTPPDADFTAASLNYFIIADDGFGGLFRTRIEIRVLPTPTYITWHVDGDNGNDKNDGRTKETAFKTIKKAHDMTNPGDTVLIYDSKTPYLMNSALTISRSGLPGAYITYTAAPGNHPVLNSNGEWNTVVLRASYVILDHLTFEGIADQVSYDEAWDILRGKAADATKEEKREGLKYTVSHANTNGISIGAAPASDGNEASPDEMVVTNHVIIRDCTFSKLSASGFGFSYSDYVTAENNTILNCCWWDMYACSGISALGLIDIDDKVDDHKIVIRNNYIAGNRGFIPWVSLNPIRLSDGNGIIIDSTRNADYRSRWRSNGYTWPIYGYASRILVANNLCYENGGSGIHCFEADHVDLINNTIYSNVACTGLDYSDFYATPADDINMFNNIVYSRTNAKMMIAGSSSTKFNYDNNLFYNYDPNRTNLGDTLGLKINVGQNNIYGVDPGFTNAPVIDNAVDEENYPDSWTEAEKLNAVRARFNPERNYDITQYEADFTLKDDSPALDAGNAEWSAIVGSPDNRLGVFGQIGVRPRADVMDSDIQNALAEADAAQAGIIIGTDESEVLSGVKFVTEDVMNRLNEAKSAAQNLTDDATASDIAAAVQSIREALTAFTAGVRVGTVGEPELKADEVSKELWVTSYAGTPVIDGITDEDYHWEYEKKVPSPGYTLKVASMCDTEFLYVAYNIQLNSGRMEDQNRGEIYLFFAGDNNQSPRHKSENRHDFEVSLNLMEDKFNTIRVYDQSFENPETNTEHYDYGNIPAIEKVAGKYHVEGDTLTFEVAIPWESFKPDRAPQMLIGWEAYLSNFMGRWGTVLGCENPWGTNSGYGVFLLDNDAL